MIVYSYLPPTEFDSALPFPDDGGEAGALQDAGAEALPACILVTDAAHLPDVGGCRDASGGAIVSLRFANRIAAEIR